MSNNTDIMTVLRTIAGQCNSFLGTGRCTRMYGHEGEHEGVWGGLTVSWADSFPLAHRVEV